MHSSYQKYKNVNALVLDGDLLKVTVLPHGGKIASIYHKQMEREFLYQRPGGEYIVSQYGDSFSEGEFSGFDDMFPTIDECIYPDYPFANTVMPDHGELWSIPWKLETDASAAYLEAHGVRLPYRFKKKVSVIENTLHLDYEVENLSTQKFSFIWAAHPLFNCSATTRIDVPGAKRIINMLDNSERLGKYGAVHEWENARLGNSSYDMSRLQGPESKRYEKYYILDEMKPGTASLVDDESRISISYPSDKVPYLGIWINEGGYGGHYHVALEPCTGPLDALNIGMKANRVPILEAGETYSWSLKIEISDLRK